MRRVMWQDYDSENRFEVEACEGEFPRIEFSIEDEDDRYCFYCEDLDELNEIIEHIRYQGRKVFDGA